MDNINLSKIVNDEGVTWAQFKKNLKPKYYVIFFYCLFSLVMILAGGITLVWISESHSLVVQSVLILSTAVWLSIWIIVIGNHFHEAAHFNLCADKKLNDILATCFLTPLVGLEIKSYRKSHWQHHLHLGNPKDTEISYHTPISLKNILLKITGIHIFTTLIRYWRTFKNQKSGSFKSNQRKGDGTSFLLGLLMFFTVQSSIIMGLLILGYWQVSLAWCIALFWLTPFLSVMRQTLEHRSFEANSNVNYSVIEHGQTNRMFGTGWPAKLFGAAGFNRHYLHHIDPTVSYTCFDDMESFIQKSELKHKLDASRTTYWKAFFRLLDK